MPRTYTLEAASAEVGRLRMQGYLQAKLVRRPYQRDRYGQPRDYAKSLRFTVEPGEHVDIPARLLKRRQDD